MIEQELEGVRREFETYKKRSRLATVKLQQELEEKKNQVKENVNENMVDFERMK